MLQHRGPRCSHTSGSHEQHRTFQVSHPSLDLDHYSLFISVTNRGMVPRPGKKVNRALSPRLRCKSECICDKVKRSECGCLNRQWFSPTKADTRTPLRGRPHVCVTLRGLTSVVNVVACSRLVPDGATRDTIRRFVGFLSSVVNLATTRAMLPRFPVTAAGLWALQAWRILLSIWV